MQRFERRGGSGGSGGFGGGRRFGGSGGPRRDFGDRDNTPKPVKVGEEYDVEISEVGSRGDGIARVKNFVVFVNGTKQGEKTHIKITEVRNRFAIGEKTSGSGSSEGAAMESSDASKDVTEEVVTEVADEDEEGGKEPEGEGEGE